MRLVPTRHGLIINNYIFFGQTVFPIYRRNRKKHGLRHGSDVHLRNRKSGYTRRARLLYLHRHEHRSDTGVRHHTQLSPVCVCYHWTEHRAAAARAHQLHSWVAVLSADEAKGSGSTKGPATSAQVRGFIYLKEFLDLHQTFAKRNHKMFQRFYSSASRSTVFILFYVKKKAPWGWVMIDMKLKI